MLKKVSNIHEWLNDDFYRQGAFITDFETGKVILGKGGNIKEVSNFSLAPAFYLKYFFENKYLAYFPESFFETNLDQLKELISPDTKSKVVKENSEDDLYREDFLKLKMSFNQGLQKVVLISRENYQMDDEVEAKKDFFAKAIHFGAGLPYGFWFKDYGVVGSTPEILFSKSGDHLQTFALAGTARTGEEAQLLNSKKDRLEHDLVIQDITEKLDRYAVKVTREETKLLPFKDMVHLKTDIEAVLNEDFKLEALVNDLSPTAALGGYPKQSSLNFLKNSLYAKMHPVRFFGSALGIITQDMSQFLVAIRNIQWDENSFFIESGGGVLPESDLEKEISEFRLKRETIKRHYL